MARKQHPAIGKYIAVYEHDDGNLNDSTPQVYETPEEALEVAKGQLDEGDVIYVYAVVGVKVVQKPTLTENYLP